MRTTVSLDPDIVAALERIRRDEGIGLSEALNRMARRSLAAAPGPAVFELRMVDLGLSIDLTNIGDVLDLLDQNED
jgi:hypothetical protein